MNSEKKICALCFEDICEEQRKVSCYKCVVLLHLACFFRFEFSFEEIAKNFLKISCNDYVKSLKNVKKH